MFERLRAAIDAALDAATAPSDKRDVISGMREAVIEAHAALAGLRDGMTRTERELAAEQRNLDDAERRGRLAGGIGDQETVEVAERFVAKHRERVEVLRQKLEAHRAEISLMERELDEMKAQMKKVAGSSSVESAWREIEAAGGARPETDLNNDLLKEQFDRAAREAHANAQLEALKKRMGR
jgi:phage shock protein A